MYVIALDKLEKIILAAHKSITAHAVKMALQAATNKSRHTK
jgi:hypothetical protein